MAIDPALIALAGTIFGGVGLKIADHYLGRSRVRLDDATQLRSELRLEITAQREEIRELENEVDKWKDEYYNLRDKYVQLQTELSQALWKIKQEAVNATEMTEQIATKPPKIPLDNKNNLG